MAVLLKSVLFFTFMSVALLAGGIGNANEHEEKSHQPKYDHRFEKDKEISYSAEQVPAADDEYVVIAWNDLGIHCMDDDFSISSTLPPFQTLWAQIIHKTDKGSVVIKGDMVNNPNSPYFGITVEYAFPDNTSQRFTSGPRAGEPKSNYWDYAAKYFGAHPAGLFIDPLKAVKDREKGENIRGKILGKKVLHVANDLADDKIEKMPDGTVRIDDGGTPGRGVTGTGLSGKMIPYAFHKNLHITVKKGVTMGSPLDAFVAEGFPLTKWNDDGTWNEYQMAEITVKDKDGNVLAKGTTVAGISDEMHCANCHRNNGTANRNTSSEGDKIPAPDATFREVATGRAKMVEVPESQQYRLNVLKLHDLKHFKDAGGADVVSHGVKGYDHTVYDYLLYQGAVDTENVFKAKGKHMSESGIGLYTLAKVGVPILCAVCHRSNAYPVTTGDALEAELAYLVNNDYSEKNDYLTRKMLGAPIGQYTHDMHTKHDEVTQNCYLCHPGKDTDCLRGTMTGGEEKSLFVREKKLKAGEYPEPETNRTWCDDCHGDNEKHPGHPMAAVGDPELRHIEEGPFAGTGSQPWLSEPKCGDCHLDHPEEKDALMKGVSLYRFSKGHGEIYCEACHGSTHAIYPTVIDNDNAQIVKLQGEKGSLYQCGVCHKEKYDPENGEKFIHHGEGKSAPYGEYDDVHKEEGITCENCHNRIERIAAGSGETNYGQYKYSEKYGRYVFKPNKFGKRDILELCGGCHERQNKSGDAMVKFAGSEHGKEILKENNEDSASCVDCHGNHRIKRVKDPDSSVAHLNDIEVCASDKCHGSNEIAKKYNMVNALAGYNESFHGKALALGERRAATCVTCHGGHGIYKEDDSKSAVHKDNRYKICANEDCHGTEAKMAGIGSMHGAPNIVTTLINSFYGILIVVVVGGLGLFIILDFGKGLTKRREKKVRMSRGE
ncbi:MAG: cytochrome c3 family protein [Deltaproteobacteria bacterium]|nr:cytochrome c3 family protein [Deltaproteobacteria bacterium]